MICPRAVNSRGCCADFFFSFVLLHYVDLCECGAGVERTNATSCWSVRNFCCAPAWFNLILYHAHDEALQLTFCLCLHVFIVVAVVSIFRCLLFASTITWITITKTLETRLVRWEEWAAWEPSAWLLVYVCGGLREEMNNFWMIFPNT